MHTYIHTNTSTHIYTCAHALCTHIPSARPRGGPSLRSAVSCRSQCGRLQAQQPAEGSKRKPWQQQTGQWGIDSNCEWNILKTYWRSQMYVDAGNRCGHWGLIQTLGTDVDTGGRCGHWEQMWTLGTDTDTGDRCGHWEQMWTLGTDGDTGD